jgi:hypothetical protein
MDRKRRQRRPQAPPLDLNLADRILSGALSSEDLPPALGPMASALDSVRASADEPDSKRGAVDRRTIESMVSYLTDSKRHPARWLRFPAPEPLPTRLGGFRVRLATAIVAVGMAFLVGVAYAGRLPAPAQNAMSVVLSKIGLSVPRHAGSGDVTDQEASEDGDDSGAVGPDANGPAHDGLCNAYFNGNGGTNGGKLDSVAFQNVQEAADDAGQSVEEFCGVDDSGEANEHGHGHGKGHDKDKEKESDGSNHGSDHEGDEGNESHGQEHEGSGNGQGESGHDGSGDQGGGSEDSGNSGSGSGSEGDSGSSEEEPTPSPEPSATGG